MAARMGAQAREQSWPRWCQPIRQLLARGPRPSDLLVAQIRDRAACTPLAPVALHRAPFEPASSTAIAAAEKSLDFALPVLLRRLLCEVGNGGFGPGHGLLGVAGGATDEHGSSLVDLYDGLSATHPDDPGWRWPQQLVPICPWGDSTYSCVDCSVPEAQLVTYDANGYRPGSDLGHFLTRQDESLESWLRAWTEGVDLWNRMFPID